MGWGREYREDESSRERLIGVSLTATPSSSKSDPSGAVSDKKQELDWRQLLASVYDNQRSDVTARCMHAYSPRRAPGESNMYACCRGCARAETLRKYGSQAKYEQTCKTSQHTRMERKEGRRGHRRGERGEGVEMKEGGVVAQERPTHTLKTSKERPAYTNTYRSSRKSSQHFPRQTPARSTERPLLVETLSQWRHYRQHQSRWSPSLSSACSQRDSECRGLFV